MHVEVENARFAALIGKLATFEVPASTIGDFALVLQRLREKNNGYCQLAVAQPHRPKSTGKFSQNNHAWGHATQIAKEVGDSPEGVLREACLQTPSYPSRMGRLGKPIPQRWSMASVEEAREVIETLHRQGAFLGMTLKEE